MGDLDADNLGGLSAEIPSCKSRNFRPSRNFRDWPRRTRLPMTTVDTGSDTVVEVAGIEESVTTVVDDATG